MTVRAVVGAQWGDEGKGKIVDFLAGSSDMVIRFQGGPNAGHTIVNQHGKFQLHGVPSGIFSPGIINICGPGTVISPPDILSEIDRLHAAGITTSNLFISDRAHVIMPHHYIFARIEENLLGSRSIGTTRRAIGPAYSDKYGRWGIRMGDLAHESWLTRRIESVLRYKNDLLKALDQPPLDPDTVMADCRTWYQKLQSHICDTLPIVAEALQTGKRILLEGQLGIGKGIEWGSYPFVTSSSPTAGYASVGAGIPPHRITDITGVVKAYSTSVGAGPMVTKDDSGIGPVLRDIGHEYGATTGRPRHCGWLDAVILAYGAQINGYTSIAITRLDVLNTIDPIGICTAYEYRGQQLREMPITPILEECRPVYEYMPGWKCSLDGITRLQDLPSHARRYVDRISELTNAPVSLVSIGPEREKTIVVG